jgi:hypothetical protein
MNFWLIASVAVCASAQAGRERPNTYYEDHPAFKNSDGSRRQFDGLLESRRPLNEDQTGNRRRLDGLLESSRPLNQDQTGDRRRLDGLLESSRPLNEDQAGKSRGLDGFSTSTKPLQSNKPSRDAPFNRRLYQNSSPSADCLSSTTNLSQDLNNLQPTATDPQLELLTKVWRALPNWFEVCQLWEPLPLDVAQTLLTSTPPEAISILWPSSEVTEHIEPSIDKCLMSGNFLTKTTRDIFLRPNIERPQTLLAAIATGLAVAKAACDI